METRRRQPGANSRRKNNKSDSLEGQENVSPDSRKAVNLDGLFDVNRLQTLLQTIEEREAEMANRMDQMSNTLEKKADTTDIERLEKKQNSLEKRICVLEEQTDKIARWMEGKIDTETRLQNELRLLRVDLSQKANSEEFQAQQQEVSRIDRIVSELDANPHRGGGADNVTDKAFVQQTNTAISSMNKRVQAVEELIACKIDRSELGEMFQQQRNLTIKIDEHRKLHEKSKDNLKAVNQRFEKLAMDMVKKADTETVTLMTNDLYDTMRGLQVVKEDVDLTKRVSADTMNEMVALVNDRTHGLDRKFAEKKSTDETIEALVLDVAALKLRKEPKGRFVGASVPSSPAPATAGSTVSYGDRVPVTEGITTMVPEAEAGEGYYGGFSEEDAAIIHEEIRICKEQISHVRLELTTKADRSIMELKADISTMDNIFIQCKSDIESAKNTMMEHIQNIGLELRGDILEDIMSRTTKMVNAQVARIQGLEDNLFSVATIVDTKAPVVEINKLKELIESIVIQEQPLNSAITTHCLSCNGVKPNNNFSVRTKITQRQFTGDATKTVLSKSISESPAVLSRDRDGITTIQPNLPQRPKSARPSGRQTTFAPTTSVYSGRAAK